MSLTNSPSSPIITYIYTISDFLPLSSLQCLPHLLFFSFHNVSDQLSFISYYYIYLYHLSLPSFIFSAMSTTSSSVLYIPFHSMLSIANSSSSVLSRIHTISALPNCFSHLLCNVCIFFCFLHSVSVTCQPLSPHFLYNVYYLY